MTTSYRSGADRLAAPRFRAPVAVACAALLGLSFLLSVGPALGAGNGANGNGANGNGASGNSSNGSGNGTSANVKVHDAQTGVETSGTDNEPRVCDFWLAFTFDAPFEGGTWVVVSWAPTGDGSIVAAGAYNTSGDGVDSSSVIELPAGHYRVEWEATGATSRKTKTFWVDAGCTDPPAEEPPAEEEAPPAEDPGTPADESPAEEPAPPAEEPIQLLEEQVSGTADESDADEPAAPVEEPPVEEPPVEEPPVEEPPVEEPAMEQLVAPSDEFPPTPADVPSGDDPAQDEDPGAAEVSAPPAQDELGSVASAGEPTMPDTATPNLPASSGLLAATGVLLLIVVHAVARRRLPDRDGVGADA